MDADYSVSYTQNLSKYLVKTYGWMFIGLAITFFTSVALIYSGLVLSLLRNYYTVWILLIAEVLVVAMLTVRLHKMSIGAAFFTFFLYAFINGITLSPILFMYGAQTSIIVFAVAAVFFGLMALYGMVTKQDLSSFGRILVFGLIGLLLMTLVSIFLRLEQLDMIICYIGLAIFLGLTAYDTWRIKKSFEVVQQDKAILTKASIFGALQLYLDFINIFLYLLRILGKRN